MNKRGLPYIVYIRPEWAALWAKIKDRPDFIDWALHNYPPINKGKK